MPCRGPESEIEYYKNEDLKKENQNLSAKVAELVKENDRLTKMLCSVCENVIKQKVPSVVPLEAKDWYSKHLEFDAQRKRTAVKDLVDRAKELGYVISASEIEKQLK